MQLLIPLNPLIQHHDLLYFKQKFFIHSYELNDRVVAIASLCNGMLVKHHAKNTYIKPFELRWKDLYDTNIKGIIPIQLLICHSVHCDVKFEEQTVFLMCPVENIPTLLKNYTVISIHYCDNYIYIYIYI